MAERVRSDHPSVTALRGRRVRRGGSRRPAVAVPREAADRVPAEGTVRLHLDGRACWAPVGSHGETRAMLGAYDNARLARQRAGTDRLAEWLRAADVAVGRSVVVDVIEAGEVYGLRLPGHAAVYEVALGPAASLRRIAEDLDP